MVNADELVRKGSRPAYDDIKLAVAWAAQLIDPTDEDCKAARTELDRRYTPFKFLPAGSGYAWN